MSAPNVSVDNLAQLNQLEELPHVFELYHQIFLKLTLFGLKLLGSIAFQGFFVVSVLMARQ